MAKHSKIDLIRFYTMARLQAEVARNYIGYVWWLLDPILAVAVYYLFVKVLLKRGGENYVEFLFVGIVAWKWFSAGIQSGSMSIYKERGLIKRIYLPKIIFPWVDMNFHTVKFLAVFSSLTLVFPFLGFKVTANHLLLPLILATQYVLMIGVSTFLASWTPYFPDTKLVVTHVLRLFFYPSGILFALDRIPKKYYFLVEYNPIAQIIDSYRKVLMHGQGPSFQGLALALVIGVCLYGVGLFLVRKLEGQYAKLL